MSFLKKAEKSLRTEENAENIAEIVAKSSELLTHLRILSLNVVECVSKWKENFKYLFLLANCNFIKTSALFLPYFYKEENYLLKVFYDFTSFFAKFLL